MESLSEEVRRELLSRKVKEVRRQWGHLPSGTIQEIAHRKLENELRLSLELPSFEEFARRSPQQTLF